MTDPTSSPADSPEIRVGAAPTIRVANKAIIQRDGRLLVTVNQTTFVENAPEFYLLPGGGQEWGEDAHVGLVRECREEIGCAIVPGDLACVRDYIGAHHRFATWDAWFHQQENFFFAELVAGAEPVHVPATGDDWQVGVAWKTPAELRDSGEFAPMALLDWLEADPATRPRYLGDTF